MIGTIQNQKTGGATCKARLRSIRRCELPNSGVCGGPGSAERHEECRTASGTRLNRQPVLLRQLLQRHLRPRADVLDHFGGGERAEPAAIFMAGAAYQAEQESRGEQVAGAGGV